MALLRYDLAVVGQEKVRAALRSVEAEVLASNRRTIARAQGAERSQRRGRTAAEYKADVAAIARAEKEKTRVALAEERKREAAISAMRRKRIAEMLRAQKQEQSAEASLQRQRSAALAKQHRDEQAAAAALQRQRSAALMRENRLQEQASARAKADTKRTLKGVLGGTVGRLASVGRAGVSMTGLGAGALFGVGMHSAMASQAAASSLANQMAGTGETKEQLAERKKAIMATVAGVKGFSSAEVMQGMGAFQGVAGESEATMKIGGKLATTSLATGGDIEEIGQMYSNIYASLRNASGGASKSVDQLIAETDEMGRSFAAMGQIGAIELKDFAEIGGTVGAVATRYAGNRNEQIQNVAAVAQIARQTGGADSAAEAATAVSAFTADLIQHGGAAQKLGVNVYSDKSKTQLRDMPSVIADLMAATGGNLEKLSEVANIRGIKSVMGLSDPYRAAYQEAKAGGKSEAEAKELGKKAVIGAVGKFKGAPASEQDFAERAASRLSDADKQLEENMRQLTRTVGTELLPVLTRMIPEIAKLVPLVTSGARAFSTFVEVMSKNPIMGIGAVISGAIGIGLGKAGLGAVFEKAISSSVAGASVGASLATALGAITIGTAAFTITTATIELMHQGSIKRGQEASKSINETAASYQEKRAAILSGPGSQAEKAAALESLATSTLPGVSAIASETRSSVTETAVAPTTNATSMMGQTYGNTGGAGALLDILKSIFQSGTEEAASKGAQSFQAQILKDQQDAAAALKGSAEALRAIVPAISLNTGNAPSPVKPQ